MDRGKKENNLIIIENGQIVSYVLDDKNVWEIGRPSKNNTPDIKLLSTTVSRKHGQFRNMDGQWFYIDYAGKNGTIYNHKHLETGINGRIKPILLTEGDTFVFGGGKEEVINSKTVWGMYVTNEIKGTWRVEYTKSYRELNFEFPEGKCSFTNPNKGTVIVNKTGIGIYMGELTYLIGDIELKGN